MSGIEIVTEQRRLPTCPQVSLAEGTPSGLLWEIMNESKIVGRLTEAPFALASLPTVEWGPELARAGVTADGGDYADTSIQAVLHGRREVDRFLDYSRAFGQPAERRRSTLRHLPFMKDEGIPRPEQIPDQLSASLAGFADGPLALLRWYQQQAGWEQTIVVEVTDDFRTRRAEHRTKICRLLASLSEVFDIVLVGGPVALQRLRQQHHEHLPGVSRFNSTPHTDIPSSFPDEDADPETVLGWAALSDDRLRTLVYLAQEGGRATYHTLASRDGVSDSRVRQRCTHGEAALVTTGLVSTYSGLSRTVVELTPAGERVVQAKSAVDEKQRTLGQFSDDPSNTFDNKRVYPTWDRGDRGKAGGNADGRPDEGGGWVGVRWLSADEHTAAVGAVDGCDVGVADGPVKRTAGDGLISYDASADTVVAGAAWTSALYWVVGTARALASAELLDAVGLAERLDATDHPLGGLFDGDRYVAAKAAQCGWLRGDVRNGADYVECLTDVRDAMLAELGDIRTLRDNDDHASANELHRAVLRRCHGLIGTLAQAYTQVGVDLVWYCPVPEYTRSVHSSNGENGRRRQLLKTIATAVTINATCGAYTAHRTMYESREEKRRFTLGTPDTTVTGGYGRLLGSWCLRGPGISRLIDPQAGHGLRSTLETPHDLCEDGYNYAEFAVPIEIRSDRSRNAVRSATRRALARKNLRPTPAAISTFAGCAGSVFDVTKAINRALDTEDRERRIHLDEVRRVLAHVPDERLLADAPGEKIGQVLGALLRREQPHSSARLADEAAVHPETLAKYVSHLEALALVERVDLGPGHGYEWHCTLPLREERSGDAGGSQIKQNPRPSGRGGGQTESSPWSDSTAAEISGKTFDHILFELATLLYDGLLDRPPSLRGYAGVIWDEPVLCDEVPRLREWISIVASLTNTELDQAMFTTRVTPTERAATLGIAPDQATLGTEVVA